jgi:hypothetical protein
MKLDYFRFAELFAARCLPVFLAMFVLWPVSVLAQPSSEGWKLDELTEKLIQLSNASDTPEIVDRGHLAGAGLVLTGSEDPECFVGEGETLWTVNVGPDSVSGPLAQFRLGGTEGSIHTVWIFYPIVAASNSEAREMAEFYSALFSYLFPDWEGAASWPRESLGATWEAVAELMKKPELDRELAFASEDVAGAKLTTIGVPPDFVIYRVTKRSECENLKSAPKSAETEEKLDLRARTLAVGRMKSGSDLSGTPIYLGFATGDHYQGRSVRLDGYNLEVRLGDIELSPIDVTAWFEKVLPTSNSELTAFLSENWNDNTRIDLNANPAPLEWESDGIRYRIERGHAFLRVDGHPTLGFEVRPSEINGHLFASRLPEQLTLQAYDNLEMDVDGFMSDAKKGDHLSFSAPDRISPIDVSATPNFLGSYTATDDIDADHDPEGYSLYIRGWDLRISSFDEKLDGSVDLNLDDWLVLQRWPESWPENRLIPISRPTIEFENGGNTYLVKIDTFDANIREHNGQAILVPRRISGELFSSSR